MKLNRLLGLKSKEELIQRIGATEVMVMSRGKNSEGIRAYELRRRDLELGELDYTAYFLH